ncbi:MAG TPA: DUF3037 domain-containing protein [Thermoanaerobaculia bacterium]|nr:DUF3037 domain-containing protein [Thermoanaerobaculia bacterium]
MPERFAFDYAVVRVVPRVDRGEFLNAGVIVFCPTRGYLEARVGLDEKRLLALDPSVDLTAIETYLAAIPKVCAGGGEAGSIGSLPQRARFHWLVAPRSTVIQTSEVHSGVHHDLNAALEGLFEKMVRSPEKNS